MKFKICGHVTVSAYTFVEAATEAEAIAIAKDRNGALAPHGSRDGKDPLTEFIIEAADGLLLGAHAEPLDKEDLQEWSELEGHDEEDDGDDGDED
jgi:hypothetical protein